MWGNDSLDIVRGIGYAHAMDREAAIYFFRTLAQGKSKLVFPIKLRMTTSP